MKMSAFSKKVTRLLFAAISSLSSLGLTASSMSPYQVEPAMIQNLTASRNLFLPMVESSRYQKLANWFAMGSQVSFDEINNDSQIWIGQCFYRLNPRLPLNSIIGTYVKTKGTTESEVYPVTQKYFMVLGLEDHLHRFLPANGLDSYPHGYLKGRAQAVLKTSIDSGELMQAYTSDDSLVHKYYSSPHYLIMERLRKYENYLILEADLFFEGTSYFDRSTGENVHDAKKGPFSFCYYFKTTKP